MRIQNRTTLLVYSVIFLGATAPSFMTADQLFVAAPGFACVLMVFWLWMALWKRDHKIPFFDVGIFCALATLVYTVYPLVNYWADGFQFDVLSDNRLRIYNPDPIEMSLFHLRHVLYLLSFIVTYAFFRGKGPVGLSNVRLPNHFTRLLIVLFFFLLTGYFLVLQITTDVNFNVSYESEAYAKNFIALQRVPLLLLQISGKLWGILFLCKLGLLFIVISRCKQRRWLFILFLWLLAEIVQVVYIKGARTDFVLFLLATGLLYHRIIRPLTMKYLTISGLILLAGFLFLGLYRSYSDISDMRAELFQSNTSIFAATNEFQSLLGTAYSVYRLRESGAYFPWYLYINDFITILPPQQFLTFEKVRASEWYLREIGLSGTGIAFMWGVISQSIVGFDWLELALRGAILGFILSRIHRLYLKYQTGYLETIMYIYLCVKIYYTFRDTTFSLLGNIVWEVIPFYILLRIGVAIFPRRVGDQPGITLSEIHR